MCWVPSAYFFQVGAGYHALPEQLGGRQGLRIPRERAGGGSGFLGSLRLVDLDGDTEVGGEHPGWAESS